MEQVRDALRDKEAQILVIAGALEADIAELDTEEERTEFLEDAGLAEPSVNLMIRAAYDLLNLQAFFTMGPKKYVPGRLRKDIMQGRQQVLYIATWKEDLSGLRLLNMLILCNTALRML